MMKINVIPAGCMSPDQVAAWGRLQSANPTLDSPFFRPEFTQAVADVRDDVDVAVLEEADRPVGFFPFHRGRFQVGLPVGYPLSDFQGVIAGYDLAWDPKHLLRGCRLKGWRFNHLLACQAPFGPYHCVPADSPYMDLSRGFEAYVQEREAAGCDQFRSVRRKARKAEREIGPVRFEMHTDDHRVFHALLAWKTSQYRRQRATNYLAPAWSVALLENLRSSRPSDPSGAWLGSPKSGRSGLGWPGSSVSEPPENSRSGGSLRSTPATRPPSLEPLWRGQETGHRAFSGVLSALYVGNRLAAAHLGMRSFGVLHFWFPAYDPELGRYSPGLVLLVEMARAAAALGIRRIDLGRGNERYKRSLMSGAIPLAEGAVDLRPAAALLQRGWLRMRESLRGSLLHLPARYVVRSIRRRLNSYALQPGCPCVAGRTSGEHASPPQESDLPRDGQPRGIATR
jgi:CelD/BcsL family acetyltransferase involved in cellulose biosynthesis